MKISPALITQMADLENQLGERLSTFKEVIDLYEHDDRPRTLFIRGAKNCVATITTALEKLQTIKRLFAKYVTSSTPMTADQYIFQVTSWNNSLDHVLIGFRNSKTSVNIISQLLSTDTDALINNKLRLYLEQNYEYFEDSVSFPKLSAPA